MRRQPDAMLEHDLSAYPGEVIKRKQLATILGCSERSIQQQMADGTFPIPRLALTKTPRWSKARVREFLSRETCAPTRRAS